MVNEILKRLEEEKKLIENVPENCDDEGFEDGESIYEDGITQGKSDAMENAIAIVEQVAAGGGWIKCSDSLPTEKEFLGEENGRKYLKRILTTIETDTTEIKIMYFDGFKWFDKFQHTYEIVTAWQLLPEPYIEE